MRMKLLNDGSERTVAIVFECGEEPMAGLTRFAQDHQLKASRFSAIGAFDNATLGYFEWDHKSYRRIFVHEQVEVLALLGDIALENERPRVHAHVVLGKQDGSTCGGHLLEARVRPTLEVIVTESPAHMTRVFNDQAGLALIDLDK